MDLAPFHLWFVFLHVVGVFMFLLGHGVSAGVMWRLRTERDPAAIRTLLDFSGRSMNFMGIGFLIWFFGGIIAGFSGDFWTTGRYWIWASLAIALAVIIAMTPLGRFWLGVLAMPARMLFVARLDGVICGTAQLITPPRNNEAQSVAATMTTVFVAPWARGHGLARMLVESIEAAAREEGFGVIHLDVRESLDAAVKLDDSLVYVECGRNPYYARIDGKIVGGRYYYKVIDPALA